jgi:hypothetical protein
LNIEHAELLLREAQQNTIVFVVSIYGINSILDARTGHAFANIERGSFIRKIRQHCEKIADGSHHYVVRADLWATRYEFARVEIGCQSPFGIYRLLSHPSNIF